MEELDHLNWGTLQALARTIDAKSHWTAGHSERVTALALAVGRRLGLSDEHLDHLHRGGLLHDIGKIGVPASVLDKPGELTPLERQIMRDHVTVGARILAPIGAYAEAIPVVLHHHERYDGSGYPHGLAGQEIPLLARVLAVPDVFDALSSGRPYRSGWPHEKAIAFVEEQLGSHFDPDVGRAFLEIMAEQEGSGSFMSIDATRQMTV